MCPVKFVAAIVVTRGARYTALGLLAVWYGDLALVLVGFIVITAVGWWWFSRRRT